jgi:tetratricopeptide (TPR) repeat protein
LVAVALRLTYLASVVDTPAFRVPTADSALYDLQGQQIAGGDLLAGRQVFFLGPLYSYYLGVIYAIAGHRLWVPVALQCVLAALTVLLVMAIGTRLLGRRAGRIAGAALAVMAPAVYFSSLLLMETLLAFLNAVALWLVVREEAAPRGRSLLGAGLALGVAAAGRPSELALLLPLGAYAALRGLERSAGAQRSGAAPAAPRARRVWPQVAMRFALLASGAAVAVAPVTLRNWAVERDPVLLTFSGGFNFYVGNGPDATGATFMLDDMESTDAGVRSYAQREAGRELTPSQVSDWWRDRARHAIARDPKRFGQLLLRKVWFFWNALDIPQIEWFTADREQSALLRALPGFAWLAPLALLGLGVTLRRWRTVGVLHATIAVYVATIALFFVTSRYRVAAFPWLCLAAAAAVDWGWEAVRRRRRGTIVAAAVATAGLVFVLGAWHLPVDPNFTRSQHHVRASHRLRETGDPAGARRELEVAIQTYPGNWEAHYGMGVIEQETGRLESSLRALLQAQQLTPRHPEVLYSLAVTYFKLGVLDRAQRTIEMAAALDPYGARMHEYKGVVAAARGERAQAEQSFRRALRLDPDRASAYNNLGTLMGSQQRHTEALALFQTALQKDPAYLPARRNMVLSWLALGRAQRAMQELQALLERAPRDTFALRMQALLRTAAESPPD